MGDLRAALVNAGATEELANKAATEVATHKAWLNGVETRLSVLSWMSGATLALCLTILLRLFR